MLFFPIARRRASYGAILGLLTRSLGFASMRQLPFDLYLLSHHESPLSADGTTVLLGNGPFGGATRWTEKTGAVALPVPTSTGGISHANWLDQLKMSDNGNVIVGNGLVLDGNLFPFVVLTWRASSNTTTISALQDTSSIGISPSGKFDLQLLNGDHSPDIIFKVNGDSLEILPFAVQFIGIESCPGGQHFFGNGYYDSTAHLFPSVSDSQGKITLAYELPGATAECSSRDGRIILGQKDPIAFQTPNPLQHVFLWDSITGVISIYHAWGYWYIYPQYLSLDGNLMFVRVQTADLKNVNFLVLDRSTPAEAAKGFQEVTSWLLVHGFIDGSDLPGLGSFTVEGMSQDNGTVVGHCVSYNYPNLGPQTWSYIASNVVYPPHLPIPLPHF